MYPIFNWAVPYFPTIIFDEVVSEAFDFLPDLTSVNTRPNIIESALVPAATSGPDNPRNTLLYGVIGAALAIAIVFLIYLTDGIFVVPDDITYYYGVHPLSTISEGDFGEEVG